MFSCSSPLLPCRPSMVDGTWIVWAEHRRGRCASRLSVCRLFIARVAVDLLFRALQQVLTSIFSSCRRHCVSPLSLRGKLEPTDPNGAATVDGRRRRCGSASWRRAAAWRASGRSQTTQPWWRAGGGTAGACPGGGRWRSSEVPTAGALHCHEKVIHCHLGLEISISGGGGDWERL